jgi:hypothetical protein
VKRNIDLTVDRDFREKGTINTGIGIMLDRAGIEEEPTVSRFKVTDTERATGILTGTAEERRVKKDWLEFEKTMDTTCHRCGKLLDSSFVLTLCVTCDRELELDVLGSL